MRKIISLIALIFIFFCLPLNAHSADIKKLQLSGVLFLTSPDTGKIIYVDLMDLSMVYNTPTKGAPFEIVSNNETLYIPDFAKDKIYELMAFNTLINTSILKFNEFPLPAMSNPVLVKFLGDKMYVLNSLSNDISIFLLPTKKYLYSANLLPTPTAFTFLKKINQLAITCPTTNTLVLLNDNNFSKRKDIKIEGGPEKIVSSMDGEHAYITLRNKKAVLKFNYLLGKGIKEIPVGDTPVSLLESYDGKYLYVANGKSNTISIVDLNRGEVIDTINLPIETQFPGQIALTRDGKWLIVPSETTNTISFIDLNSKSIAVKLDVGATTHGSYIIDN
jgi:YVTN family beta-propeller protein